MAVSLKLFPAEEPLYISDRLEYAFSNGMKFTFPLLMELLDVVVVVQESVEFVMADEELEEDSEVDDEEVLVEDVVFDELVDELLLVEAEEEEMLLDDDFVEEEVLVEEAVLELVDEELDVVMLVGLLEALVLRAEEVVITVADDELVMPATDVDEVVDELELGAMTRK